MMDIDLNCENKNLQKQCSPIPDYKQLCDKVKPFFLGLKSKAIVENEVRQNIAIGQTITNLGLFEHNGKKYNLPFLFALYRANVNNSFTEFEFLIYPVNQIIKAIALSIWRQHKTIFDQRKAQEKSKMQKLLRRCIRRILSIKQHQTLYDYEKDMPSFG